MDQMENYKSNIIKMAENGRLNDLTDKQLQCIFQIMAHKAHTSYRHCAPEYEGKKINYNRYIGAGWFVEDHYE